MQCIWKIKEMHIISHKISGIIKDELIWKAY